MDNKFWIIVGVIALVLTLGIFYLWISTPSPVDHVNLWSTCKESVYGRC